jgi:protein SCO1
MTRRYNAAMNTPSASRALPVWLILVAALAAGSGLWLGSRFLDAPARPRMENAVLYPQPRVIPDFHLTQANGQALSLKDWQNHWDVVYFGYTNCPDVCPTTLAESRHARPD